MRRIKNRRTQRRIAIRLWSSELRSDLVGVMDVVEGELRGHKTDRKSAGGSSLKKV